VWSADNPIEERISETQHPKDEEKVTVKDAPTVGIIGLGIGRAHIRAFLANGCRVVGLCQRDEGAVRKVAAQYGIDGVFTRWEELIERARPDIVVIATPPPLHRDIALAAFAAGAHVLCEKPLAMNLDEAREMVDAAAKHRRVAMTCFNWRFTVAMEEMNRRLKEGFVGRVFHVSGRWHAGFAADEKTPVTWRMDREQAGHGAMGDMGVHLVDLVRWNVGEIASVCAHMDVAYPSRSADDHCSLLARLTSGALVVCDISRVARGAAEHGLQVFGSRGSLAYRLQRGTPQWFKGELHAAEGSAMLAPVATAEPPDPGGTEDPMEVMGSTLIAPVAARLLDSIRTGVAPSPSFDDGLRAQAVLDAVFESAQRKVWIDVVA